MWQITGTLVRVKEEQDSDFHLVIADSGGRTMILEIPAPACISSSPFLPSEKYVRQLFTSDFHPSSSWQRPDVQITVKGVGYFDYLHGQSGVAPNGIELHPCWASVLEVTPRRTLHRRRRLHGPRPSLEALSRFTPM